MPFSLLYRRDPVGVGEWGRPDIATELTVWLDARLVADQCTHSTRANRPVHGPRRNGQAPNPPSHHPKRVGQGWAPVSLCPPRSP